MDVGSPVTTEQSVVVLAIILALLVNMFFLFRVLPWARPGPWRLIWALAALFSLMWTRSRPCRISARSRSVLLRSGTRCGGVL